MILTLLLGCTAPLGTIHHAGVTGDADTDADSDADSDADTDADADTDTAVEPDTGELRGVWVDRWTFSSADDVETIMANSAAAGFNTVFFQIRGNADAYYDSQYEPWSKNLTGTLGQDPGWDPLQVAVESGHSHGLAVHAYVNAFPLWAGTTAPTESTPRHAYLAHPDWLVADGAGTPMALNSSYVWMSPGNPAVRARLQDVVEDIVTHYDVDGVHLDLVRYPGADYSHDATSEAEWDRATYPDYGDWQRAMVVGAVQQVRSVSPVPVTAAVWGVYENDWGWSSVSEGRNDYYQDSRAFLSEGATDGNMPMIYWPVTAAPGDRLDFTTLVQDFVAHDAGRYIFAGISADLGEADTLACIESARANGARGIVIFDYGLMQDGGWLQDLKTEAFATPTTLPNYPWRH